LTEKDFDDARYHLLLNRKNIVTPDQVDEWIKTNVVGEITYQELDDMRHQEVNGLDMMQNSCIIYHSESILETQILCLLLIVIIEEFMNLYEKRVENNENQNICMALLIEHIFSYSCTFYRKQEIKHSGQ
jgi:hypothetical protein